MRTPALRLNGQALRAIRERSGMSGAALATKIGRDPAYVSRLERGERQPSPATLAAIRTSLNVDLGAITHPAHPEKAGASA